MSQGRRPVPPTVVLPGAERTRLLTLSDFPADDEERHAYLAHLAYEQITTAGTPAWGFLVEVEVGGHDAVAIVYGARKHAPAISAAPLEDDQLGEFVAGEELDPTAMPYLHPLQHAVDALPAMEGDDPFPGEGGLPLFE